MQPGRGPRPFEILRELLTRKDAAELQQAAARSHAVAVCSGIVADRKGDAVQAAHLGYYERLAQRGGRRHHRPVQFEEGVLLLGVLVAGANVVDAYELSPPLAGLKLVLAALAANAIWLTLTWLAASAGRERRWAIVASAAAGASLLALLLAAVHGTKPSRGWPTIWGEHYGSTAHGIQLGLLLLALGVGAAVLIAHTEPASCFTARRRWHQAHARYEAAVAKKRADSDAASAAVAAWLGLVRSYARDTARANQDTVEATVALAADLLTNGRPGLPPALPLPPEPE